MYKNIYNKILIEEGKHMKSKKIVMITKIVLIMVLIVSLANTVFAYDPGNWVANEQSSTELNDIVGTILGFVQVIGSAIAVIMIVVLGIKYMVGSAEEKAEYKKTMIPYLVGAICIFAASTIANVVYNAVT